MATQAMKRTRDSLPVLFEDLWKPWDNWFDEERFRNLELTVPAVNIRETKDQFQVTLAVPGMKKEDFKIDVEGNMLTISSEKKDSPEEKKAKFTRREYNYSTFSRSFTLPDVVDREKIEAVYKDGVLKLVMPRRKAKVAAAKKIVVK